MAVKKATKRVKTATPARSGRAVRLDLSEADHKRLEGLAKARGLNKASYARQALFERMKADEKADEAE
jgi:hypothetical protein